MKHRIRFLLLALTVCVGFDAPAQYWKWAVGSICPRGIIESWPVTVDSLGNVYAAGGISSYRPDSTTISVFGSDTVHGKILVLTSTDSSGHYRWTLPVVNRDGVITKLALGPTGDVYMFGCFSGKLRIGTDSITAFTRGAFIARIDVGGHVRWLRKAADTISSVGDAFGDVDLFGNAYLAGSFTTPSLHIGSTALANSSVSGCSDVFLAKYDTLGNPVWATSFGGDSSEKVINVAVTPSGQALLVGSFRSNFFPIGSTPFTNSSPFDYFYVIRFDNLGHPRWGHPIENHSTWTTIYGAAFDQYSNAYIAGGYRSYLEFGSITVPSTIYFNGYLAQLDDTGAYTWARVIDGSPAAYSVASDGCGNVWLSGSTGHNIDEAFMARFSIGGMLMDSVNINCGGDDQSHLALDNKGNIYFGSDFLDSAIFGRDTLRLTDSTRETMMLCKCKYRFCADIKDPPLDNAGVYTPNTMISLYPNPAGGRFAVTVSGGNAGLVSITITDLAGRELLYHVLPPGSHDALIATSGLAPGSYICRIQLDDHAIETRKLTLTSSNQ